MRSKGSLTENDRQYGAWLCAPTFNTRKCFTIRVGGSEDEVSGGESYGGAKKEVRTGTSRDSCGRNGPNLARGNELEGKEDRARMDTLTKQPYATLDSVFSGGTKVSECIVGGKPVF